YKCARHLPHLHSFPTRRSSDLALEAAYREVRELDRADGDAAEGAGAEGGDRAVSTSAAVQEERAAAALISQDVAQKVSLCVRIRSEEHTSELQSLAYLVCRLLL